MTQSSRLKVGDRVAMTVSSATKRAVPGTVRNIWDDAIADVQMDNGHWASVLTCHLEVLRGEEVPS